MSQLLLAKAEEVGKTADDLVASSEASGSAATAGEAGPRSKGAFCLFFSFCGCFAIFRLVCFSAGLAAPGSVRWLWPRAIPGPSMRVWCGGSHMSGSMPDGGMVPQSVADRRTRWVPSSWRCTGALPKLAVWRPALWLAVISFFVKWGCEPATSDGIFVFFLQRSSFCVLL